MAESGADTLRLDYARGIVITRHDGYVRADVRQPWDSASVLHTYLLVPDSASLPANLPEGTVVRTPLRSALIYSSVHNSLVCELGAIDAIAGVCDAAYIHDPALAGRLADGKVADCGPGSSPSIERIISLSPDGILLSPYENAGGYGKVAQTGIPLIECADYLEVSPLARAEWMKFYGLLFGREAEADRLFAAVEREYLQLRDLAATSSQRTSVLVDCLYGQTWYVPSSDSTMGRFIADAGARNPFEAYTKRGSVGLSGEKVLYMAGDADVWLIRYHQSTDKTMRELAADNPLYNRFGAFRGGRVYGCNTSRVLYYEDVPFHPHRLLRELICLFHPELATEKPATSYFTPLKP